MKKQKKKRKNDVTLNISKNFTNFGHQFDTIVEHS